MGLLISCWHVSITLHFFLIILTLSDLLFTLSWALFNEIRILIIHWKVRWVDVLAALNNLSPKKWPFFFFIKFWVFHNFFLVKNMCIKLGIISSICFCLNDYRQIGYICVLLWFLVYILGLTVFNSSLQFLQWLLSDWWYLCSFLVFSLQFRFNYFQFQYAVFFNSRPKS